MWWRLAFVAALACGMSIAQGGINEATRYSDNHGERALLVWQGGRMVKERYRNGGNANRAENIYSITKSLCALSMLSALGRDRLPLNMRVAFAEWRKDAMRSEITIRELLSQTSGLSTGFDVLYAQGVDKEAAVLRLRSLARHGTSFAYGPAHYEALEVFVSRRWNRPAAEWLRRNLLGPLGIAPGGWRHDRMDRLYFSAGAKLTARDLLRVGQLVRRRGWNGILPLIPSASMREATTGSAANAMYGMGLWLNANADGPSPVERDAEEAIGAGLSAGQWKRSCLSTKAPADLVAMVGSDGQRVYISRSRKLVIVRLGRGGGFRDPDFLRAFFR